MADPAAVEAFLTGLLVLDDPKVERGELPPHDVSPLEGKLLHLIARIANAQRILELGTLAGYSTIWLARALPTTGHLTTLEIDPGYAATAQRNIDDAGLSDRVDIRVGPALETLATLEGPFDLVFLDADKRLNPEYLEHALRLAKPGTVLVADNVVRPRQDEATAQGVRRFLELLAEEPRITATALQTVGAKGHDGFVLALVSAAP